MDKKLLKFCRYYHGEQKAPDSVNAMFWGYEKSFIEMYVNEKDVLSDMLSEYSLAGLSQFESQDDTPAVLKALLFNRYCNWRSCSMIECAEPFKKFYLEEYMKKR